MKKFKFFTSSVKELFLSSSVFVFLGGRDLSRVIELFRVVKPIWVTEVMTKVLHDLQLNIHWCKMHLMWLKI